MRFARIFRPDPGARRTAYAGSPEYGTRGRGLDRSDPGLHQGTAAWCSGFAIAVLGFLWIAYLGFAKFNEARQGKAEWAEVGVLGIVGAIVLTFASYLLTEAAGVI